MLLYTGAMTRDLTVEQHSRQDGLAFNHHTDLTQHHCSHPPGRMHSMPYIAFA